MPGNPSLVFSSCPLGGARPSVDSVILCIKVVWAFPPFGLLLVFLHLASKTVH